MRCYQPDRDDDGWQLLRKHWWWFEETDRRMDKFYPIRLAVKSPAAAGEWE